MKTYTITEKNMAEYSKEYHASLDFFRMLESKKTLKVKTKIDFRFLDILNNFESYIINSEIGTDSITLRGFDPRPIGTPRNDFEIINNNQICRYSCGNPYEAGYTVLYQFGRTDIIKILEHLFYRYGCSFVCDEDEDMVNIKILKN